MGDLFAWLVSFFVLIALLVVVVYQLMCLADLEFDYINPYDSASRINRVILPEFVTQGVLCCFFSCNWALGYVTVVWSIPVLQCEIVHKKTASGRRYRDIQLAKLGKEATAFQTRLSDFSPLSLDILDDYECTGRT